MEFITQLPGVGFTNHEPANGFQKLTACEEQKMEMGVQSLSGAY